ncbi:MAG: SDR family oxidoreductase, partial [Thermoanaerobaculia bacterium]
FTSGSTGEPKGTLATRRRWAEEMCVEVDLWPYVGASFQPSAIAGDRGSVWRALTNGGRVGFARRGAELFHDLRRLRPTLFDVPPVIWNTLYGEYRRAISRADLDAAEVAAIRRRFRDSLGGRIAFMATGGAPSDEGVRQTMETLFGVPMSEGYGTTETGFIARNGVLLPGIEYRLIDRPELGFTAADRPLPRGELAVRTARSTARYLGAAAGAGAEFTEDGYFLTGDLVELGPGRRVRVVGRSKLTFKLAGAELVSPEELERVYSRSEAIEQIWIAAAPGSARVVAVVVPRRDEVDEGELTDELLRVAGQAALRPHERVAGVVIARREGGASPWTVANRLLTPSFKLNRRVLEERYREAIVNIEARPEIAPQEGSADDAPGTSASSTALSLRPIAAIAAIAGAILRRPREAIDLDRSFAEQGGDSLATLELAMRLEEVFGGKERLDEAMHAAPEALARRPLRELAAWFAPARTAVESGSAASGSGPAEERTGVVPALSGPRSDSVERGPAAVDEGAGLELANRDAIDLPAIALSAIADGTPQTTSRDVLLTGANGFLGIHLLARLERTLPAGARVFAIVRAASDLAACERLRAAAVAAGLAEPSLTADPRDRSARVVGIAGRLDAERFGLAARRWEDLAGEVGLILHVAASVTGASGYESLRGTNVVGTRRALELATTSTIKAFHLVSSLNVSLLVAGPGRGIAAETTPIPARLSREQYAANTGYAITKWVGERMVQELARRSGGRFRASISRPALLSWSRATGYANDHDWLTRVLSSCLTTRSIPGAPEAGVPSWIPESDTSARGLDLVPVDFAAEAIERLAEFARDALSLEADEARGTPVFHVSNLAKGECGLVTLPRLLDLLLLADLEVRAELGLDPTPLEVVTPAEWRFRVESTGAAALPILGQLRQSIPSLPRTPTARFRAAVGESLADSGIDAATIGAFVRAHASRDPGAR